MATRSITVQTSPSLALIKYWGKSDIGKNLPATSSLAVTLDGLFTETTISTSETDLVIVDGKQAPQERYAPFFNNLRKQYGTHSKFSIDSRSNFPASAGLASSSSGFAALAYGCAKLIDPNAEETVISECARLGSASAARAVYGGFTILPRNGAYAQQILEKSHWPELRIIIAITKSSEKKIASREAMEAARKTSPYYAEWIAQSEELFLHAVAACKKRDLDVLGPLMRQSYLMMFSTMFTSTPPVFYWEPESIALIKACEDLRENGYSAWETMDAGPQVKIVCLERNVSHILETLKKRSPGTTFMISQPGNGPLIR